MPSSTSISKTGLNDDNVILAANESEIERLEKQHKVVYAAMQQLVLAPVDLSKGGYRILDQATGSDVRQAVGDSPNTWVGTDIEDDYFPKNPPSDISYYYQSMTEPWPVDWQDTFNLVHSRMALPGVGLHPLEEVVKNLVGLLKPGGWIQLVEMNWNSWEAGPTLGLFNNAMKELVGMVTNEQGVDMRQRLIPMLETAGLTNLQQKYRQRTSGSKGKDRGPGTESANIASGETEALPEKLVNELRESGGECKLFVIWAQKPAV